MAIKRKLGVSLKGNTESKELSKELDMPSRIPATKNKPSDSLRDYVMLIYGLKKIGKTSICQFFEDAFFLMCEPGAKSLAVRQTTDAEGNLRPVKSWHEFKAWVKMLEKDKTVRTIIVDPIDRLFKLCDAYACQKLAIKHPSEAEWGKGWAAVRDEFEEWILGRLLGMGKGVIFISHAKDAEIKTRTGETYNKITSTMANQAKEVIEGVIDIWCHYRYDGSKRVLTICGDDHIDAGHRLSSHFRYTDGTRVRDIPMGKSEKEAYENFTAAFENKLDPENREPRKKMSLKLKR